MTAKSVLLLGATGATGSHVLTELLSSPHVTRVGEYGRRTTPTDRISGGKEKLEQKTIDFERLGEARLSAGKWDVVIITPGTSKKAAGSAEAFEKIDREYVINAARAAKSDDADHTQRLVYLSSGGASSTSSFLYMRSKGLTELGLAGLGYSDTIIFRPGYLKGEREKPKTSINPLAEAAISCIFNGLSHFSGGLQIQLPVLAKSICKAAQLGSAGLPSLADVCQEGGATPFTCIGNAGAVALAETDT